MTLKRRSPLLQAFEVIIFTLIIGSVGYYVDSSDPLLVNANFSFMILWLAIVTLFYGLNMGLIMWISFAIMSFVFYHGNDFFTSILLENLFFVFLFGLFFSNLHDEMDKYKIKNNYLQLRLKELTNAFFTLKISHDKLESIYIIQPASFRFVISEILESSDHNTAEDSAKNTLKVLKKFFSVNAAMIYRVKRGSLERSLASVGDINTTVEAGDKLIEEVLLQKKAMYLSDLEDEAQTAYIYAVPFLDKRSTIVAILIVKDIPFLYYNQDTLLKINVVFNYIWTEYKKRASLDEIRAKQGEQIGLKDEQHERQDIVDFKLEVIRLSNILKDYNIDSRIYSIYTKSKYLDKEIEDFLYENELFEVLDQYVSIKCANQYIHLILFPFVSSAGIHNTISDVDKGLEEIEGQLRVSMLEEGLQAHLSEKSYQGLRKKHISVRNFNNLLKEYACE
ncbi:MAG: Extracellular Matrix protein PelD [uncultured Sulfurovum sp.]|uniref:Extracellular Matrix protein PelD n=1 Tax=uncultured Sulfurovum sp. TaxID=269237 RepID=A0A6S6U220_9BACT|nr:MAG: Extracellular Matrix protein PelD [uncultured Sulfurovum sp.]